MSTEHYVQNLDKRLMETVAVFGTAQLLKTGLGGYRLIGGSDDDRQSAREWVSLFLHEAVVG
jgi:hypothetical protein